MLNAATTIEAKAPKVKRKTEFAIVAKRLSHNSSAVIGFVVFAFLVFIAVFAPLLMPYSYDKQDLYNLIAGPSWEHLCGTDDLGRDLLSRLIYGSRYTLSIGILSVFFGTAIGMVFGAIAGYFGGLVDIIVMRLVDVLQSIPGMLLAIIVSVVLGPGFFNAVLALSVGTIPMSVRLLRASVLGIRSQEYLEAATAINCSKTRIILRHVIPNSFAPLLVSSTMGIGNTILAAAALSFIGLGIQPPMPEWGAMISAGRNFIRNAPHMVIFPGIFIMLAVLALNMFGDGLRDALDPKLKQ